MTVPEARAGALEFLSQSARDDDGGWVDFNLTPGSSTDWVCGFVAAELASIPETQRVAARAIATLARRARREGGWGYNRGVQVDSDSTAWGLLALAAGRFAPPLTVGKAVDTLLRHQDLTGGFSTYLARDGRNCPGAFRAEWFAPQACVTAAAIMALLAWNSHDSRAAVQIQHALAFLVRARTASGLWSSCWWTGPHYPTYHATLVLSWRRVLTGNDRAAIARAVLTTVHADGGWSDRTGDPPQPALPSEPFATALALRTLLLADPDPPLDAAIQRGAAWLAAAQQGDGSFPSTPMLRIPDETTLGAARTFGDGGRIFTTATVAGTLDRVCRRDATLGG
jgi:squalene-hopene/tetraprenyl-beta-curcumene cyclase